MARLSFYGAVNGVTGSCFLLETSKSKILIDCGMVQGERMCSRTNFEEFGFEASEIDAVVVSHAHYDHIGRIPLLIKRGFIGRVYMTAPTKDLGFLVLEDAQRIMVRNAEKCDDKVLYDQEDVEKMRGLVTGLNYHTEFEPAQGLKVMFHQAGHILGSAYITVDIPADETKDGQAKRLLFSGDVGNDDVPILPDTEAIQKAGWVICESTYGDRDHVPTTERKQELEKIIKKVIERGGTLLIPAFSIERTQELLYDLDELVQEKKIPRVPFYLDSPLAIRATSVYRDYKNYLQFDRSIFSSNDKDFFSFKGLKVTLSVDDSKAINSHREPKVIIAGSGMMTGGRIMHHLKRYLSDEKNGVLIIGYQAEHTLGRKIQDGASIVEIFRDEIKVRASVDTIDSFSAHGDRGKIRRWLVPKEGRIEKVFLVHGDIEVKPKFKKYLEETLESKIVIPKMDQKFLI